jgi:hypothetical protein
MKIDFLIGLRIQKLVITQIEASFSMTWADYSSSHNKAKVHLGFDLNRGHQEKVQAH